MSPASILATRRAAYRLHLTETLPGLPSDRDADRAAHLLPSCFPADWDDAPTREPVRPPTVGRMRRVRDGAR